MAKKVKKAIPWLTILGTIAVIGLVAVLNLEAPKVSEVKADTAEPSVTVGNTAPVASAVHLNNDSAITLTEYTTKAVNVTSTVTDDNGCDDLTKATIALYKSGATCASTSDADNDVCYFYEDTTLSWCSGTSGDITHTFDVQYYADPDATWTAEVIPYDEGTGTSAESSQTLSELQSLDVSASISYGSVSAGSNSTGDHTATTTDTGNVAIDVQISGTAMSCDVRGSIATSSQEYATSTFSYGAGTDLSDAAADWNLDLPTPEDTNVPVTDATYWQVGVPTGSEGTCSGTNTFTARSAI